MTRKKALSWLKTFQGRYGLKELEEAADYAIKELEQKLLVIEYNGAEHRVQCQSFEFRTNQVSNWIRIKHLDGSTEVIRDVCVIKAESGDKE